MKLHDHLAAISSHIMETVALDGGDHVVLLNWDGQPPKFCNLLRVNSDDEIIWTATPLHPLEGIHTGLRYRDGELVANTVMGSNVVAIDLDSGSTAFRLWAK